MSRGTAQCHRSVRRLLVGGHSKARLLVENWSTMRRIRRKIAAPSPGGLGEIIVGEIIVFDRAVVNDLIGNRQNRKAKCGQVMIWSTTLALR